MEVYIDGIKYIPEQIMKEPITAFGMTLEEIREIQTWKMEFEIKGLRIKDITEAYMKGFEDCKKQYEKAFERMRNNTTLIDNNYKWRWED